MNRRDVLKLASLAAVGGATATTTVATATSANSATPQWPGHVPGKILLGWSPGGDLATTLSRTGPVGLRRSYFQWGDGSREDRMIKSDQLAGRASWVSFKPPFTSAGGWAAVAAGKYDADIRARARRYAALTGPVISTFNHEPHNDQRTGTPAEFAAAFVRIHDVMKNETGLKNVAHVPIIGEWAFSRYNKAVDPEDFITPAVLNRCPFLGVDLYQNKHGLGYAERLGAILAWLDQQGHSTMMVGLGETGATNAFGSPTADEWWSKCWKWAAANTGRVGAISYWNSARGDTNWILWETSAKLNAYKSSLASTVTVRNYSTTQWGTTSVTGTRTAGAL